MSIPAINWALECPVTPSQKSVLFVFANYADSEGLSWPSMKLIQLKSGLSERTVRRVKNHLAAIGLIETAPEIGRNGVRLLIKSHDRQAATMSEEPATMADLTLSGNRSLWPVDRSHCQKKRPLCPPHIEPSITTKNHQVPPIAPHPPSRPKSKPKQTFPEPPDWVDREAWFGWLEMRRRKGAPATDHALALTLKKLAAWRDDGHDVAEILNTSTERGWTGVFEPRPRGNVVQLRPQFEAPPARSSNPFDGFYERFVGEDPPPFVESSEEEKRILRAAGIIGGV